MRRKIVSKDNLFKVLDFLDSIGLKYWIDGGWGVDVLYGKQTREHRDIDINFDSVELAPLLEKLEVAGYQIETDWRPTRIELCHSALGHIDIHPFILAEDGSAKQVDLEGGFWEIPADCFGTAVFSERLISCTSLKGQLLFHSGYELREVDKHDLGLLEELQTSEE